MKSRFNYLAVAGSIMALNLSSYSVEKEPSLEKDLIIYSNADKQEKKEEITRHKNTSKLEGITTAPAIIAEKEAKGSAFEEKVNLRTISKEAGVELLLGRQKYSDPESGVNPREAVDYLASKDSFLPRGVADMVGYLDGKFTEWGDTITYYFKKVLPEGWEPGGSVEMDEVRLYFKRTFK